MKTSVVIADGTFPCQTAPLQGAYETVFPAAAEIGYDEVQLTVNRPEEVDVAPIQKWTDKTGIRVSGLATGMGYTVDGLCLGAGSEPIREAAVERMMRHVDLAECLGGAMVIVGAIRGRFADAGGAQPFHRQFRRSTEELLRYAEKKKIAVLLEANDHLETDAYITVSETAQFVRGFESPFFKLQLDTMHLLYEHEDSVKAVLENRDILGQVDISGEGRRCPPDGTYDYPSLLKALSTAGFAGPLVFEYCAAQGENGAKAGYDYIQRLIKAL